MASTAVEKLPIDELRGDMLSTTTLLVAALALLFFRKTKYQL